MDIRHALPRLRLTPIRAFHIDTGPAEAVAVLFAHVARAVCCDCDQCHEPRDGGQHQQHVRRLPRR